jgi:hypothetical protein
MMSLFAHTYDKENEMIVFNRENFIQTIRNKRGDNRDAALNDFDIVSTTIIDAVKNDKKKNWMIGKALAGVIDKLSYYSLSTQNWYRNIYHLLAAFGYSRQAAGAIIMSIQRNIKEGE